MPHFAVELPRHNSYGRLGKRYTTSAKPESGLDSGPPQSSMLQAGPQYSRSAHSIPEDVPFPCTRRVRVLMVTSSSAAVGWMPTVASNCALRALHLNQISTRSGCATWVRQSLRVHGF